MRTAPGPLAEQGGGLLRRQPGDHPQLEDLAVVGGQPVEGRPDGGVVVGDLDVVGGECDRRRGHGAGPSPVSTGAAMVVGDNAAGDAEQPRLDPLRVQRNPVIPATARVIVSLTTSSAVSRPTWWAAYAHSRG